MNLTDIVSGAGLSHFQQIALTIFVVAFLAIVVQALLRPKREIKRLSRMALDDNDGVEPGQRGEEHGDD